MLPLLGTQGHWELMWLSEQKSEELAGISLGEARCGTLSSDSKTPLVIGSSWVEGHKRRIISICHKMAFPSSVVVLQHVHPSV